MYGDPAAAAPYWAQQSLDDCGLMAAADVIGQLTHRVVSEQEIIAVARRMPSRVHPGPVYTPPTDENDVNHTGQGTEPADLPVLLARYGISAALVNGGDLDALEHYLVAGHKVIAGVNAELIWGIPVETKDTGGNPAADHAVVVTGVDTASGKVHINDSAVPQGKDETVPIEVFVQAWATSSGAMIVTAATA
ncbi:C39 family peptidase [Mycobacterium angelicum]|nr:C39 family peptidase [Mycobacterium angelicum]